MKKELNAQLRSSDDKILPESMKHFFLFKKKKSKMVFRFVENHLPLSLYIIVQSDPKSDSLCAELGWNISEDIPELIGSEFTVDHFDKFQNEYRFDKFTINLLRFHDSKKGFYEVIPVPLGIEELIEYSKPLSPEKAQTLIEDALVKIKMDLEKYATSYFDWVIQKRQELLGCKRGP